MATYTYSNWITQTSAATRLTQLRLHIAEVAEKIDMELGADGKSRGSSSTERYYETLLKKEDELQKRVQLAGGDGGGGRVSQVRFRRA